jgi:hypothetical protein
MATDEPTTSRNRDQKASMEVDWPHAPKTSLKHHSAGTTLEPAGKEEEGKTTKQLAQGPRRRMPGDGTDLGPAREDSPEPRCLASPGRRPMPQEG